VGHHLIYKAHVHSRPPATTPDPPHAHPAVQEGLALRGWRDRGSCFELRASSLLAPDAVTCLYEAEVLLLAPGPWATHCLDLFGLQLEGLQVTHGGGALRERGGLRERGCGGGGGKGPACLVSCSAGAFTWG